MASVFDPAGEASIRARVARLTPDASARWGKMDAPRMVCHLLDSLRVPLGEIESRPKPTPFRFRPLRWLFVYTLPIPKGKIPTAPEYLTAQPGEWEADVAAFLAALDRFVARGRAADPRWKPHLGFGPLPNSEWGRLTYRHSDHHLRQFGV